MSGHEDPVPHRVETMERAEYVARVDEALCTGCGLCDAQCHFHAIDSHTHGGGSHARIDPAQVLRLRLMP